jgi:molybdate transport system ATP-binding protein
MTASRGDFKLELALSVPPGETVALLGPNGAGKSTAVAALAGLLPIDSGTISLSETVLDDPERDVFVPAETRSVGVVFQEYLLFPHLSVIENVAFGLRSRGTPHDVALGRAAAWLERLEVSDQARSKPGTLSGGQAQRVALARALVTEPDMLLLDEPLAALDVTTRVQLRRVLAEHLDGFPGPRLLITHDPTEAFLLADVIHIIEEGAITQAGTADDIRIRPKTRYAADLAGANLFLGTANHGEVRLETHRLNVADLEIGGPVLVTFRPSVVSIHLREPEGSPRNTWETGIDLIEDLGDRVRILTGEPLAMTAEVTAASANSLQLAAGSPIWVSIKATEISVEPNQP